MTTINGVYNYAYDNIYQLTGATHPTSPTESFSYDGVGNRLSSADYSNWAYDENNRLTSYNGTAYTYDENGNMVTKTDASGMTTYTYDSENKLVRIDLPGGGFVEYVYDGLGRRIEKNVDGTITRYIYDMEDILFEYDATNTITARYTHGPGIDDPIAMERDGQSYFYHADGLGSITEITDTSGGVVASYQYDSFGKITSQTGSHTNPYTYTGREYDPESELYYHRARYYDPAIGRFLQTDPLDMATVILLRQYFPANPLSMLLYQYALKNPSSISNVYPYVLNNPINWVDPGGLMWPIFYGAYLGAVYLVTVYGPYLYYTYIGPASVAAYLYIEYLVIRYGPQLSHIVARQIDKSTPTASEAVSEGWRRWKEWEEWKEREKKTCD